MALLALWNPNIQFLKTDGTINAGGKIVVTDHNDAESIPANYSDADGTTLNASPIVLDSLGRATCYIDDGRTYDLYVKDANGATLWTVPEMTPGAETIVVRAGFSLSSNDSSVAVVVSVDQNGVTNYDLSIQKEIDRSTEAEKGLSDAIEAEKNRAESAEIDISKSIADETKRATEAEKGLSDSIEAEKNRAESAESALSKSIADKAGTASPLMDGKASVGNSLKYAREDHVHPSDTSKEDKANKTTVVLGTSESKYPTDKAVAEFVNSSIATNTANYISNNGEPFTSVEQLEAYSGPVTNNDYAFVTGTDSEGNTYYDRYKATVSGETVTWALEYRLNNSSFTAAQWSAINSGITSVLVAKIHDHSNKDVLDGITSSDVANWNSKMDSLQTNDITIANGDKLVVTDASDSSKVARASISFDGSTTTKALTPKGTFEAFAKSGDITTAIQALDVSSVGGDGKYISAISETDGKISAAATTMDTTPTANSTKAVTSGGIKTALNDKFDKYGFFGNTDGKWIGAALSVVGETEVKYWKLCSFTTHTWWTLNFVADVTNATFDTNVFERKIIAIHGSTRGGVASALEIREGNNRLYSTRGYGNIIYYETSGNNVTIYIKARFSANQGQYCRLVSVLNVNSISNLTWYQETSAGTQPKNPVKFSLGYKTVKPAGSASVPVYIGSDGNPTACTDDFVHDGDVTSTYSSTGTAPVNGKAVASALGSYLPPSGSISAGDDLNSYNTDNRNYICNANKASTVSNKPSGASGAFELEVIRGTGDTCVQVYYSRDDVNFNYIRKRTGINNAWTDWVKLVDSSDINKSAGDLTHPCYFSKGIPKQCYGVSTWSLFTGMLNAATWTSISGTASPTGNTQYIVTNASVIDLRKTGGTIGNTGSIHIRAKGDGNACRTLTVQYLDKFGNSRSFEIYWGNSSHFTRVNEFIVFWAENLFPLNNTVNRHCTIVPVYLPDLFTWDGESR